MISILTREEWQKQYSGYTKPEYDALSLYHGLTKEQVDSFVQQATENEYKKYVDEQVRRIRSIEI